MTSIFLFCFLLLFSSCLTLCDRDLTLCDRDSRFWGIKLPKYPSGTSSPFSKTFEAHLTSSDLILPEFNEISLLKVGTGDMFASSSSDAVLFLYTVRLMVDKFTQNSFYGSQNVHFRSIMHILHRTIFNFRKPSINLRY